MPEHHRRTLLRGAAWSVPVIAIATHAPAFAASTDAPSIAGPGAFSACRDTGLGPNCQGYRFTLNLTVQPSDGWDIVLTEVRLSGADLLAATAPRSFVVTSTANIITFNVCGNFSASQVSLTLRYSATNRRTGVTTSNLGGTYTISGISNKCAGQ